MKQMYIVTDSGYVVRWYFANSEEDAIRRYKENNYYESPRAKKQLTDMGFPITRLGELEAGTAFHRLSKRGHTFCEHSAVYKTLGSFKSEVNEKIVCRVQRCDIEEEGWTEATREEWVTIEQHL